MTTTLRCRSRAILCLVGLLALGAWPLAARPALAAETSSVYVKGDTWQATMLATRAGLLAAEREDRAAVVEALWEQLEKDYPIPSDWMLQDLGQRRNDWFAADGDRALEKALLASVARELEKEGELAAKLEALMQASPPREDPRWLDLYVKACEERRARRLATVLRQTPKIVFTKHHNLAGSHYAYTEGQSDAQAERHFRPGAALCILEMDGIYGKVRTLIDDPEGVIRDPDVSYDGKRILFAWKKSDRLDDYHLYELEVESGRVRQLTAGLGFADYEGIYLPDGDILFNSTRCVQTVDCWWTEVSNLYRCDKDGRFLRRLSFDQVHTNYPQVLDDGRIVYTRWEYNDRGQIYPQPLFQMNPDGTNQTEFYGNNSFFPTSILHARGVPGTQKVVAIASGHHSSQAGKLILVDPTRGRQENQGVQLIAPMRETPAERIDAYGQEGDLWMYPYPLNPREFLVTFLPGGRKPPHDRFAGRFGVFYMDLDGRRELLVRDPEISCNQSVPLVARTPAILRPSVVDYRKKSGTYYLQDIYRGPGLAGIPRGTIKALRVVALDYRAAGVGSNGNWGALVSTPVAVGNGSWDPKIVLGSTPVYEDGSAMFQVPARTPVYFQAVDANGHVVQTMRSWSTLQPGECASCVGCHENKNESPPAYMADSIAMRQGARNLEPFYEPARGFSFPKEIQPILDRHCTGCHHDRSTRVTFDPVDLSRVPRQRVLALSPREGEWRYTTTEPKPQWQRVGFDDSDWPVGMAGFGTAAGAMRPSTPWTGPMIWLRRTFEMPEQAAPAALFVELFLAGEAEVYLNGELVLKESGVERRFETRRTSNRAMRALRPGRNVLAVVARQERPERFLDVALIALRPCSPEGDPAKRVAFSLLGETNLSPRAKRLWSDAYLALTNADLQNDGRRDGAFLADPTLPRVNWVYAQTQPPMLPPYHAGAAKSGLITMLLEGHEGVKLSREELDKLACWIDLAVPYCGDYLEANAWSEEEMAKYVHFLDKRRRMEAIEARNLEAYLRSQGLPTVNLASRTPPAMAEVPLTLELVDAGGATVARRTDRASPARPLVLQSPRRFQPGDRIRVSGARHLAVQFDPRLGEAVVFAPTSAWEFAVPAPGAPRDPWPYPPEAFAATSPRITVRPVALRELDNYRNLARNPYDVQGDAAVFPHAASNSECRNSPVFAARNAIDGLGENAGHGAWPYQSWGPERREDVWWEVDFGREVQVDKVVIVLRADFPHDKHWRRATLVFSDGERRTIRLQEAGARQTFTFPPKTTTSLRLVDLVQDAPLGWCALSEIEAWGRDPLPVAADLAATAAPGP